MADRLVVMADGQVQVQGPRDAVLAHLKAGAAPQAEPAQAQA